jgi:hypothetical protein
MTKNAFFISLFLLMCCFTACKSSINADDLYGKWKYIKIEKPKDPQDVIKDADVAAQSPYIQFSKDSALVIMWGGKVLSHGKFTIDGHNIRYTESLPDGTTRQFPFWVSKLTDRDLIFETTGENASRVTAVKE